MTTHLSNNPTGTIPGPVAGLLSARNADGTVDDQSLHHVAQTGSTVDLADRRAAFLKCVAEDGDLAAALALFEIDGGPMVHAVAGEVSFNRQAFSLLRAEAGIRLTELATHTGLSAEVLAALETGSVAGMGRPALAALARALSVDAAVLEGPSGSRGRLFYRTPDAASAETGLDQRSREPMIRAVLDPGEPVGVILDPVACIDSLRPESIAAAIIESNGLCELPIPVAEIAYAAGIDRIADGQVGDSRGALLVDDASGHGATILYRRGGSDAHDNRTIGHELGHYLMRHHAERYTCSDSDFDGGERQQEAEANRFANHLMAPERLIASALSAFDGHPLAFAAEAHRPFGLTVEPMIRRLADRADRPVLVLKIPQDGARYAIRNDVARQWFDRPDLTDIGPFDRAIAAARANRGAVKVSLGSAGWLRPASVDTQMPAVIEAWALCDYPGEPYERVWLWCSL